MTIDTDMAVKILESTALLMTRNEELIQQVGVLEEQVDAKETELEALQDQCARLEEELEELKYHQAHNPEKCSVCQSVREASDGSPV